MFDRRTRRIVEELIDNKIVLAMRTIYQSKLGLALLDAGDFLRDHKITSAFYYFKFERLTGLLGCLWVQVPRTCS